MPLDSKKLKEVQERLDEIRDAGTEASFAFKDMSQQIGQIAKNSGDLRDSIIASGKAAKDLVKESNELAKFTTADFKLSLISILTTVAMIFDMKKKFIYILNSSEFKIADSEFKLNLILAF